MKKRIFSFLLVVIMLFQTISYSNGNSLSTEDYLGLTSDVEIITDDNVDTEEIVEEVIIEEEKEVVEEEIVEESNLENNENLESINTNEENLEASDENNDTTNNLDSGTENNENSDISNENQGNVTPNPENTNGEEGNNITEEEKKITFVVTIKDSVTEETQTIEVETEYDLNIYSIATHEGYIFNGFFKGEEKVEGVISVSENIDIVAKYSLIEVEEIKYTLKVI
ncbi:MAG: hypothetical protein IJZ36_04080, partial [Bacilli bacterium]|nr:hypothetical protein [Bacilli bacterium]